MADFTALKTAIQDAIKQNGNEEITGNLLQQILLSMVTTLGDSAINELLTALNTAVTNLTNAIGDETTTRQSADTSIIHDLNAETQTRANEDTQLENAIQAEASARQLADNSLSNNINAEVNAREIAVTNEAASRAEGDNVLQLQINGINLNLTNVVEELRQFIQSTVQVEANARQAADNTLAQSINAEAQTRSNAIINEAALRLDGDNKLQLQINGIALDFDNVVKEVRNILQDYSPIIINGNVSNAPDENDLTTTPNNLLKFKDNVYNPLVFSGMGKKFLRKNLRPLSPSYDFDGFVENISTQEELSGIPTQIFWDRERECFVGLFDGVYYLAWTDDDAYVPTSTGNIYMYDGNPYRWNGTDFYVDDEELPNIRNILTQDMLNEENTIYVIRYDFTLGEDITVPANCVLEFDGGSIRGGVVNLNNCLLEGNISLRCDCKGRYKNSYIDPRWFGGIGVFNNTSYPLSEFYSTLQDAQRDYPFADSLDNEMDYCGIQAALNLQASNFGGTLYIPSGIWKINKTLVCLSGLPIIEGQNMGDGAYGQGTALQWTGGNGTEDEPLYILDIHTVDRYGQKDPDAVLPYRTRPAVKNIMFLGTSNAIGNNPLTTYVSGLWIGVSQFFDITNCGFSNVYNGIDCSTTLLCNIDFCRWYNVYRDCIYIRRNNTSGTSGNVEGSTTCRISRCEFSIFGRYGVLIEGQVPTDNFSVQLCDFEGTTTNISTDNFVQGVRAVCCFINNNALLFKDNRFESCTDRYYNIHLCNSATAWIETNSLMDTAKGCIAVSSQGAYTGDYTTYFNTHRISDISASRNMGFGNNSLEGYKIINNYQYGRYLLHVLGIYSFNVSINGNVVITNLPVENTYQFFNIVNNAIDYENPISFPDRVLPASFICRNRMWVNGTMMLGTEPMPNLKIGAINMVPYDNSSTPVAFISDKLCINANPANDTPLFYFKKLNSNNEVTSYKEAGVLTTRRIRYDFSNPPTSGNWNAGDICFSKNFLYMNSSFPIGFVCLEGGTPGKWAGFGRPIPNTSVHGPMNGRPEDLGNSNLYKGFMYLNTDSNFPIWWSGTSYRYRRADGAGADTKRSGTFAEVPTSTSDVYEGYMFMINDTSASPEKHFPIYAHIDGNTLKWYKADGTQYAG